MRDAIILAVLIGTGATAAMDLAALVRKQFGTPLPDYGLVGRWLAWLPRGRLRHERIAATPPVKHERLIGWTAHYLTGIVFAFLLLAIFGVGWVRRPAILPALIVGVGSLAAPFLLMQPGMGLGVAARRAPHPGSARLRSLVTHASFGLGLYGAGWAAHLLCP